MEKKDAGKIMYDQGISQKEISEILNVQPKTVNLWVKNGNWDKQRSAHALAKQTSEERVWQLINHQLKIIEMITKKHEEVLDDSLEIKELKALLIERGDIDALQKLFTTIKGKELEWSHIVKIVREFIEYVEREDISTAQKLTPLANEYLNNKRQEP